LLQRQPDFFPARHSAALKILQVAKAGPLVNLFSVTQPIVNGIGNSPTLSALVSKIKNLSIDALMFAVYSTTIGPVIAAVWNLRTLHFREPKPDIIKEFNLLRCRKINQLNLRGFASGTEMPSLVAYYAAVCK
jgi:hypothetical protein